jgi:hypothetical protein
MLYSAIHSISHLYPRAVQRSVFIQQYFQENETKATCSIFHVEAYLKVFHQSLSPNGRRRGAGVVSRSIIDGRSIHESSIPSTFAGNQQTVTSLADY